MDPHDRIFSILLSKADEVTWQSIIYELVKTEQMDPWDIDVSVLTQKYIDMLRGLKEHDFRVSGKVLLAAAILLKMKSNKLVGEDLSELDRLLIGVEGEMEELGFEETTQIPKLGPMLTIWRKLSSGKSHACAAISHRTNTICCCSIPNANANHQKPIEGTRRNCMIPT